MSEILRTSLETATFGAAAIGAGAGTYIANKLYKANVVEDTAFAEVVSDEAVRSVATGKRMAVIGAAAAMGAGVAGTNMYAWYDEPAVTDKAAVQLVVDRSGATFYGSDNPKPYQNVNNIIDEFQEKGNLTLKAHVATDGKVSVKKAKDVKSIPTAGEAPMRAAFESSVDAVTLNQREEDKDVSKKRATVVLTNGNAIGKADTIVKQAEKTGTQVYIVNVHDDTKKSRVDNMREITKKTKGAYYEVGQESFNPAKIAETVSDKVSTRVEETEKESRLPLKIIGLIALAGAGLGARSYRKKSRQPE